MPIKTKLAILAAIVVAAPMVAYVLGGINFVFNDFMFVVSSLILLATVFFGVLFALYFMKLKSGNLGPIQLYLKRGIYLYITFFVLLVVLDIYNMLPLITIEDGYLKLYIQRYFWIVNYPSLILIALMYLGLRINKSISLAPRGTLST